MRIHVLLLAGAVISLVATHAATQPPTPSVRIQRIESYQPARLQNHPHQVQPSDPVTPANDIKHIAVAQLQRAMNRNSVLVIDVRSKKQFKRGHIHGARSISWPELEQAARTLPRDRLIVAYCT